MVVACLHNHTVTHKILVKDFGVSQKVQQTQNPGSSWCQSESSRVKPGDSLQPANSPVTDGANQAPLTPTYLT